MKRNVLGAVLTASLVGSIACSWKQGFPGDAVAENDAGRPFVGDDGTDSGVDDFDGNVATSSGVGTSSGTGSSSGSSGVGTSSGTGTSSGVGASSGSSGVGASSGTDAGASSGTGTSSGADAAAPPAGGSCTWSGALSYSGNASFTCYYFGQGSATSSAGFKTACGYIGHETTAGSEANCGENASDVVTNIANTGLAKDTYFAAIPGDANGDFSEVVHCGECAKLTNTANSKSVIVTIIDECPIGGNANAPCVAAGHLDVSVQAFNALDYTSGDPSGTTWKSVPCPVTGTIQAALNADVQSQVYLQNMVFPIKSVSGATQSQYGYWDFGGNSQTKVTLTDVEGHTVSAAIPKGGGDLKVQFPSPGTCN